MKNIIWEDLIQNIIRCIIAYPIFLIAFVISIPLNIIGWFGWIFELVLSFVQFVFTGNSGVLRYSGIVEIITNFSLEDLMIIVFPVTLLLIREISNFNDTLYPIKRSYNEVDRMYMFNKVLEEIKRS